jgi:hypothetical protein
LAVEVDIFAVCAVESEVDNVELFDRQAAEVVLDTGAELLRSLSRDPAALVVPVGTHLADQHQVRRIGVEGSMNQFIGDMRPVVLGGIYVIDPLLDGSAENRERGIPIPGRSTDTGAW